MSTAESIARIASTQHGLITLAQAIGAGLTPGQIRRRVRLGEWVVLRRASTP